MGGENAEPSGEKPHPRTLSVYLFVYKWGCCSIKRLLIHSFSCLLAQTGSIYEVEDKFLGQNIPLSH